MTQVTKEPEVAFWLGKIQSEASRKSYSEWFSKYQTWTNKTAKELLELKTKDVNGDNGAEHLLDTFMIQSAFTSHMKLNIITAVRSFYAAHYKDLASRAGKIDVAQVNPYRVPTPESLREWFKGTYDYRSRALAGFVASTFIREGSIPLLTLNHVNYDIKNNMINDNHISLKDYELKGHGKGRYKGVEQHTFLTPETHRLLIEYLEYRRRRGEQLMPQTPLFAIECEPYTPMNTQTIITVYEHISKRSGIKYTPHDMRRYGQTQLEKAGLNPNWIRKITGHKCKGEEAPYSQPNITILRKAYESALLHIEFLATPQTELTEADRLKLSIVASVQAALKDHPEREQRLIQLKNILSKTRTIKEINEAIEEQTK